MKGFGDFFSEARSSQASEKAKKLGLKGDGHGGWYDRAGEFVAKTEKGDLKFFTKGQNLVRMFQILDKQQHNLLQRLKQRLLLLQVNKLQQQTQKHRNQREVEKKRRQNVVLMP